MANEYNEVHVLNEEHKDHIKIFPEHLYLTIPANWVCTYHKLLIYMADFGKSIVDVMSVNLMIRRPFEDEYEGGKHEIIGYRFEGQNGKSKIPFKLKRDKHYMITFIPKNRFGQTDAFQITSEFDFSTNTNKDIGICNIIQDW